MAITNDEREFDATFENINDDPDTDDMDESKVEDKEVYMTLTPHYTDIGNILQSEWNEAESNKLFDERRFLRALRQYRGVYDPEIIENIDPARSKAYIRLTRTKVKTYDARMMDVKFPANKDKDWDIEPTPIPELSPPVLQELAMQIFEMTGKVPTNEQITEIVQKFADSTSSAMEKEISDQLAEFDYRSVIRDVIHSGHVYGTGVLKGPLVKEVEDKRWVKVSNEWKQLKIKRIIPTAQFVSIWDIYPDMSAKCLKDCRYVWQKHQYTKHALYKLSKRSDFKGDAIRAYLEVYPHGNAEYKHYENDLRDMSSNTRAEGDSQFPKTDKFELHERWGFIDTDRAKELLPDEDEATWEAMGPEVALNVWLIDNIIIKAIVSPVEGAKLPYYFYYFDKDETSIFGDGIPEIMRDPQMLYNASIRAMLDNAAISAGPIIEANIDLLADNEDPTEIFPFRVFQRIGQGLDSGQSAIRVSKLPSYTREFLGLVEFFQTTADESTTIPRSLSGISDIQGGGNQTATGMSMLMSASNVTLKDQVGFMDEGITRPFIKAMYFWNMEFNPKEDIKGDYNVVARGAKSLVAKEVKMEQLNQFLVLTNNDYDNQYIKRDVLLRELAEVFDLNHLGFIKSESEVKQAQETNAQAEKRRQDMSILLEALKAESSGHVPDAIAKVSQVFNIPIPGINPGQIQETQSV